MSRPKHLPRQSPIAGGFAPFASLLSIFLLALTLTATGCSMMSPGAADATDAAAAAESKISFANGEANWIITEGLSRSGRKITFTEARIDGNGWLVLHPFKDGQPDGAIHVGASYLRDGLNKDITVTLTQEAEPQSGEMFLVMLHRDVNEDQVFDFVFVDERNVLDKAVLEGMTMIAHVFLAP